MKLNYNEIMGWLLFLALGVPVLGIAILGIWLLFFDLLGVLF